MENPEVTALLFDLVAEEQEKAVLDTTGCARLREEDLNKKSFTATSRPRDEWFEDDD